MRPSLEEITELIDRERPSTEEIYNAAHQEKRKDPPVVTIPHDYHQAPPIRNLIDPVPEAPVTTIGRLRRKQARLEAELIQQNMKAEASMLLRRTNAVDMYLAHCETTAAYDRYQFGSLWKSAMQECGAVVVDWRKVSTEDICDAALAVKESMLPPLNSWRKLTDPANKSHSLHRLRVRKYSKLMADYLNNEHHFNRERQKKATEQRALLRRLRLHAVVNPFNHDRTNKSQALHPATIDLRRMRVAVDCVNAYRTFGKHTDVPLHPKYLDELVAEIQLTVSKGEYHVKPLHASLAALADPWKRSHFTRFMDSIM